MPDFPKGLGATAAEVAAAILVDPDTDKIDGSQIDASITSRSTLTQAQIISDTTPFLGASISGIKTKTDVIGASIALESGGNLADVKTKTELIGASVALETGGNLADIRTDYTTARATKMDKIQDFLEEGSGTLMADNTERIAREYSGTGLLHAYVDFNVMTSGNVTIIRQFMKIKSGGEYRKYAEETYNGIQALPLLHIVTKPGKYGVKITLQQSTGISGNAYDWETLVEQAAS